MSPLRPLQSRLGPLVLTTLALVFLAPPSRSATPRVHAIVDARIVTAPGKVIPRGTIVMRDGVIVAVGSNVQVPPDARIWSGDSLTVYPGMIDVFTTPTESPAAAEARPAGAGPGRRPAAAPPEPARGAAHELPTVRPETRMVETLPLPKDQVEALRAAGFTAVQAAPRAGILRGTSAVVSLGDGTPNANLIRADVAQVIALETARNGY